MIKGVHYEKKLVSIIIPVFNLEKTLKKCITIINQTYKNLNIIIVNDGSKDKFGGNLKLAEYLNFDSVIYF